MEKKNIKGMDDYFYYCEDLDTSFVLTAIDKVEYISNTFIYRFTPVYGPEESEISINVAYFESFDEALTKYRIFRIENIEDIVYNFESVEDNF